MYCAQCGIQLDDNAKFCSNCGQAVIGSGSPAGQVSSSPVPAASTQTIETPTTIGTKWLNFWTYFSLPIGGIVGLLISLAVPALGIILVPLAILQFAVAYGLHHRRLWAWQWNWVIIVITYISMTIPEPTPGSPAGEADLVAQFVIRLIIGGLIWLWPNHVYWKKRRSLFS